MLVEVSYYIEKIKEQENDYKTQDSFNISKVKRYYNAYELELTKDDKPYGLSLYTSYYNRIMKNYNMIVGLDKTSQEFNMDKDKKIYEYVKDFIDYKY